ncbi:hypothetical protein KY321_01000 [Candidatus Woesearchaeota archaeon]|nr:hypothetical protein [Candidatus Woesearchaeota archaeon]
MTVKRYKSNPIVFPDNEIIWQTKGTFNGCPIEHDNHIHLVYRAISSNYYHTYSRRSIELSTIGITRSMDGLNFKNHEKFISPRHDWERYGCEDPRITKMDGKYYIFYTALSHFPFRAEGIKVAVAISKDLKTIEEKNLVTPFNAKAMCLFPEKINGEYWVLFSYNTDKPPTKICMTSVSKMEDLWDEDKWKKWEAGDKIALDLKRCPKDHVEVGAPPIKTKEGWLIFYSYIKNYFSKNKVFGVEAILLDSKDPSKVIAKSEGPIMVPDAYYEKYGVIPDIVFPTGVIRRNNKLLLYYGGADTVTAVAEIDQKNLLERLTLPEKIKNLKVTRFDGNPIIEPTNNSWENFATLNPTSIYLDGKFHILYRAMGNDMTSTVGYATSKNGVDIDYRSETPIYIPTQDFEMKKLKNGNSGCEDARITKLGNKIYMFYTAYDSINHPRVAFTWIKEDDFVNKRWNWAKPVLASPPYTDNKDACLFPEKIDGKYYILHRTGTGIDLSTYTNLDFSEDKYLEETKWLSRRRGWWDEVKIGISATPIKTKKGWLVFYHGIKKDHSYHVGAFLLDLKDPFKLIARTGEPIFSPEKSYEKVGIVNNVVFPCGVTEKDGTLFIYYGGADKVTGVATIELNDLLKKLV